MTITTSQITGLVLAGGRGSRMGGVDKGLQAFRGSPMVLHVIMRLAPQVGALMINANQNIGPYEGFGYPVWPDQLGGFEGPLAGLQTGLSRCETPYLVTAPCDSPFVPDDLVMNLAEGLQSAGADIAVAVTEEGERRTHPVFALMKTSVLGSLDAYLQGGGRKIETWYRSLPFAEVPFEDADAFRNINTVDELRRFEQS
ncbi:molybdenum cofactor guanylyltransferase MobA [Noviherbaspirillum sp. ST9]|uniref:molybdenum cofactor guanylyltransferase MobA n=1 Tax=Noviherbaspirillum sp. ST9 TaxID=3401606 RepID=UPI003B58A41F